MNPKTYKLKTKPTQPQKLMNPKQSPHNQKTQKPKNSKPKNASTYKPKSS